MIGRLEVFQKSRVCLILNSGSNQKYPKEISTITHTCTLKDSFMETGTKPRSVTPEKVVQILNKHGTKISLEEAKIMLEFLYKFGKLTLDQVLKR